MKDTSYWQEKLARRLARAGTLIELTARQFLEVELGLYITNTSERL